MGALGGVPGDGLGGDAGAELVDGLGAGGEQEVDLRVLAGQVGFTDQLGYEGWIGCEYKPPAGTREGLGWIRALAG